MTSPASRPTNELDSLRLYRLGLFAWLLYENWRLTLVALAIIPLSALVIRLFSTRVRRMGREAQRAMGDITHVLGEAIGAHKVVKPVAARAVVRESTSWREPSASAGQC